jgi:hypothetical protein
LLQFQFKYTHLEYTVVYNLSTTVTLNEYGWLFIF